MDKDTAKQKIKSLVDKYELVKSSGKIKSYNEEETKKDFIAPLFETLGWNMADKNEVSAEENISNNRADFGFYVNGRAKFYLEAKKLSADIHREDFANQCVKYSWNKGVTWAVLSDFENIKVFNAQNIEKDLSDKLFFEISCTQFLERFDQLWLLSKESFESNLLDKEAERVGKKMQKISVNDLLYKDLNECREILTRDLSAWNKGVDRQLIEEGVQKLLDRLIFIRVAEDRGIEDSILIPLIRQWENSDTKETLYQSMIGKFREMDNIYNSNLFSPHPFEHWEEYGGATKKVVNILYGKKGYYEYDFKAMPADVLGTVYENYLGYKLAKSKKGLALDKDSKKRKEQGIYYTPSYIVDYIVNNALKPVLDKCQSITDLKKIRVLDPACGSGSFLIKALEAIFKKYEEFGNTGGTFTKLQILIENIYGVDLDSQAVEIARLNLLVGALDQKIKLPSLSKNIKNGNSLISGTDEELEKYFGKNFRDKKPFNWEEEFPEVFKQGGFDVIIGNPPYIRVHKLSDEDKKYFWHKFKTFKAKSDIYDCFMQKSIELLKDSGIISFIVSSTWLSLESFDELRKYILDNCSVINLTIPIDKVFQGATVDTIIFKFQKIKDNKNVVNIFNLQENNLMLKTQIKQSDYFKNHNYIFKVESNQTDFNNTKPLKDLIKFTYGFKTGDDKKFLTKDKNISPLTKNFLRRSDFSRYKINFDNEYVIYDPKKMLENKKTARPGDEERFEQEKIILQDISKKIIATIDNDWFYIKDALIFLKNSQYSLYYLLAIINSKFINSWYKNNFKVLSVRKMRY